MKKKFQLNLYEKIQENLRNIQSTAKEAISEPVYLEIKQIIVTLA